MMTPDEYAEQVRQHEADRAERAYQLRREKFALAIFRTLAAQAEPSKLTDWPAMARQAVEAADSLDDVLNPDPDKPLLPQYEP